FLDPFTLGSVEIARGPGSVSYGSDAFGGVINARSRYPEPGNPWLRFELNNAFGAAGDQSAGLEAAGDVLGGSLLGQVTYRRNDENAEAGGGDEILDSEYEDRSGALRYLTDTRFGRLRTGFSFADVLDAGKPA